MQMEITQGGFVKLSRVFNPIIFQNERGERVAVCQSDGGFEIKVIDEMQRTPPERLLRIIMDRSPGEGGSDVACRKSTGDGPGAHS